MYVLMKAHIVRQYMPPTYLCSVNSYCPPTLESETMGSSMYHINISVGATTMKISTSVVEVTVKSTVYSEYPNTIYAVSKLLFPTKMFGGIMVPSPPCNSPPPPPCSGQPPRLSLKIASLVTALSFSFLF
ncbi:hypothetical protein TSUD_411070 [Trifolium subterraneum]|uniref:Uncharacterized protein n=1 Tax=Trifolium subterraneum TaxID=3900 RepID=A0A2Z6PUS6_TRISU|nr:hypothetical protein TSUD_411070 [Trifolium subterraneum]